jgi:hypothetical protein
LSLLDVTEETENSVVVEREYQSTVISERIPATFHESITSLEVAAA